MSIVIGSIWGISQKEKKKARFINFFRCWCIRAIIVLQDIISVLLSSLERRING
jgi:hypothetical protein